MNDLAKCTICGEPMPPGEEMFQFHGYSGPCPKSPIQKSDAVGERANVRLDTYQNGWKPEMSVLPAVAKMLGIVLGSNTSQEDRRAAAVTIVELLIPELLPNDWVSDR